MEAMVVSVAGLATPGAAAEGEDVAEAVAVAMMRAVADVGAVGVVAAVLATRRMCGSP